MTVTEAVLSPAVTVIVAVPLPLPVTLPSAPSLCKPAACIRRVATALALVALAPLSAQAFCGFYAGKADAQLFNEASQVVMVRDGQRTVISMLNDYKGDLTEFALVVPVPVGSP